MIDIKETYTEEEFLDMVFKKGKSKDSLSVAKTTLSNLQYFCKDVFKMNRLDVLSELTKEFKKTNDSRKALVFLNKFVTWLEQPHPNVIIKTHVNDKGRPMKAKMPAAIKNYTGFAKKWFRLVGGIKVDIEDYKQFVSFPADENDEEAEPLEAKELRLILDHVPNPRRKTMYMAKKDLGFRIIEMCRIKNKYRSSFKWMHAKYLL